MRFSLTADCQFSADDLDDAFAKLSEHFTAIEEGHDSNLLESGSIELQPAPYRTETPSFPVPKAPVLPEANPRIIDTL